MKIRLHPSALGALKMIYDLHDEQVDAYTQAGPEVLSCSKGCASCCTCNVTLTSLEAALISLTFSGPHKDPLLDRLEPWMSRKRFVPKITFNGFARRCASGAPVPEEENDPDWGRCGLLDNEACTIYPVRPFGCRALMSSTACGKQGYARVPDFLLTLNNLFMQAIEHLDRAGVTGNLSDMLVFFLKNLPPDTILDCTADASGESESGTFIPNEKISVLMIPSEHREKAAPVVAKLNRILMKSGGE